MRGCFHRTTQPQGAYICFKVCRPLIFHSSMSWIMLTKSLAILYPEKSPVMPFLTESGIVIFLCTPKGAWWFYLVRRDSKCCPCQRKGSDPSRIDVQVVVIKFHVKIKFCTTCTRGSARHTSSPRACTQRQRKPLKSICSTWRVHTSVGNNQADTGKQNRNSIASWNHAMTR